MHDVLLDLLDYGALHISIAIFFLMFRVANILFKQTFLPTAQ